MRRAEIGSAVTANPPFVWTPQLDDAFDYFVSWYDEDGTWNNPDLYGVTAKEFGVVWRVLCEAYPSHIDEGCFESMEREIMRHALLVWRGCASVDGDEGPVKLTAELASRVRKMMS
jgi:hypothetical protein